jgi:hypothetical protein
MNQTLIESAPATNDELLLWIHKNMPDFTSPETKHLPLLSVLAQSDGELLKRLIDPMSGGLVPDLFRMEKFKLGLYREDADKLKTPKRLEDFMCHSLWKRQLCFRLGYHGPNAMIHSYQVPLLGKTEIKATDGNTISERFIDLLASSSSGLPIVIEAKHSNKKNTDMGVTKLFAQFFQGLCYAVTLRYVLRQSPYFRQALSKLQTSENCPPDLPNNHEEIPIVLAADPGFWNWIFNWGDKYQHWKDLNTLVTVAQNTGYPIYLGVIQEPGAHDPQWQFQVIPWHSLPTPTTNGPIQFPKEPTS